MTRPPLSLLAAAVVVLLGLAGLVRGAVPQQAASPSSSSSTDGSVGLTVGGGYVREPANGVSAAAYFTVYNPTGTADQLLSVTSGAGALTSLHTEAADGSMRTMTGLTVPAHGSLSLTPGKGHVMIEKLYGPIKAGQSVNLQLSFAHAGQLLVTVPVIGVTAAAPSASVSR
ncbi:MAG TPA: copper chaperone PCu(A)C [Jatrophihabitans sp.]|nr:copper chaperone PCu(A)C [Jatrophihabitans sp.]